MFTEEKASKGQRMRIRFQPNETSGENDAVAPDRSQLGCEKHRHGGLLPPERIRGEMRRMLARKACSILGNQMGACGRVN